MRALAGLLLGLFALSATAAGSETEVLAAQTARFQAMVATDAVALGRLLAEDLHYTHSTGSVEDRAAFLAALAAGQLDYQGITPQQTQIRILGDTAVLTGEVAIAAALAGRQLQLRARYTEVQVWRDGRWQLLAWQSTRIPD